MRADLAQRNETQAETIKALWHRVSKQQDIIDRLNERTEIQQRIIDSQRGEIEQLNDPKQRAEAIFKEATDGKG